MKTLWAILLLGVVIIGLAVAFHAIVPPKPMPAPSTQDTDKTVTYACAAEKSITATFHLPTDAGVDITLSDGRTFTLPHALSADGARYATADEKIVFWNKGNGAFILENDSQTYSDCMDTSAAPVPPQTQTYTNTKYHFTIAYPSTITPETSFTSYYALSNKWRAETMPTTKGVPIVAFPVYRIDNNKGAATGKPYPLYFDTELRVGASTDATDVKNCLANDPGFTDETSEDVTINGTAFKKFSFGDAAMMQYVDATSYRTVHNNTCFVIEQVKTGSHYRDDTMTTGVSDDTLDSYYAQAGDLINSFTFTN